MRKDIVKMRKIGIMGGTFNPIHIAHLILAESAYEQLNLDMILFMPSKNPPHKIHAHIVSDEHRIRMIQLAIKDNSHFALSKVELEREGLTYTAETLESLTKEYPENEYYFIIGADSLLQIEQWKDPEIIFKLSQIVAVGRDHLPEQEIVKQINHLIKKYDSIIHFLNIPNMDVSSKILRNNRREGKSIRYYVPNTVANYIEEQQLYKEEE